MTDQTVKTFVLDGADVPFSPGQTVLQASLAAGAYIPHLCSHPEFKPHGSCRVCTVKVDGRTVASCTLPAREGLVVESETAELRELRRGLVQLLFVEGNHFCPSCEKSGGCTLQAVGYALEVLSPHFPQLFPDRPVDASHPDLLLDFNRCILCELCVRASSEIDNKHVFALSGRGIHKHLIVNAESGRLKDTAIAVTDTAVDVCPVGVILKKRRGFAVPIGQRRFDQRPISAEWSAPGREAPRAPDAASPDRRGGERP
jgi:[NiFe] hydrogenase diaphorase moiety small subunit